MFGEVIKLKREDYPDFFDAYGITEDTAYFNLSDFKDYLESREHDEGKESCYNDDAR